MLRQIAFAGCCLLGTAASAIAQAAPPVVMSVKTPVRARRADVSEFRAAVPAVDSGGHCEAVPAGRFPRGQHGLLYVFGEREHRTRSIMVLFDSLDTPVSYSDGRGDLRAPIDASVSSENPIGPRTIITLNLLLGTGMLQNTNESKPSEALQVQGPFLIDAPNLGMPGMMIERIRRECGS